MAGNPRPLRYDQAGIEAARVNLAHAVLAVASEKSTSAEDVKAMALQVMRGR